MCVVILLTVATSFLVFSPRQSAIVRHPQGRETQPVTEVFINNMVDTKIRETAIDCGLEMEMKRGQHGQTDQVLRAVASRKGDYLD